MEEGALQVSEKVRRVILLEIDTDKKWSSSGLESHLLEVIPQLGPVVFGEMPVSEVDAAFRKLRQLSRETQEEDTLGNRVHSAYKAVSFFQDMFPARFWEWFEIGENHERRKRLGVRR